MKQDEGDPRIETVGLYRLPWVEMLAWCAENLSEGTRSGRLKAELTVALPVLDAIPVMPLTWVNPLREVVHRKVIRVSGAPLAHVALQAIDPGGVFLE